MPIGLLIRSIRRVYPMGGLMVCFTSILTLGVNDDVVSTKKVFAGHPAAWRDNEIEYCAHSLD